MRCASQSTLLIIGSPRLRAEAATAGSHSAEVPDAPRLAYRLRSGDYRPHQDVECTAHKGTPPHSILLSARSRTDCGIVMPSALAALRLTTSSKFVGCSTGRSAGFAPLRMRSTYQAKRW